MSMPTMSNRQSLASIRGLGRAAKGDKNETIRVGGLVAAYSDQVELIPEKQAVRLLDVIKNLIKMPIASTDIHLSAQCAQGADKLA